MKTQEMKTQHTPGPWELKASRSYVYIHHRVKPGVIRIIAEWSALLDETEQEYKTLLADAALIASAPALYEALKGLLGGPGIDMSETALIIGPNAREAIIAARAALASATPQGN